MPDMFTHMMQELAGILKIEDFAMDSQTQCTLDIDGFIVLIQYIADADQVLVASALGAVPNSDNPGGREQFYRSLLQGQFLFKETAGATFAVDPENSFVSLQLVRDMTGLAKEPLFSVLETFMNVAALWRTRLETETEVRDDDAADMTEMLASYLKV